MRLAAAVAVLVCPMLAACGVMPSPLPYLPMGPVKTTGEIAIARPEIRYDQAYDSGGNPVLATIGSAHIGVSLLTWQNEKIVTAPMPLRDYVAVAAGRECAACGVVTTFTKERPPAAPYALTIEVDALHVELVQHLIVFERFYFDGTATVELRITPWRDGVALKELTTAAVIDRLDADLEPGEWMYATLLEAAMQEALARAIPHALKALGLVEKLPASWPLNRHARKTTSSLPAGAAR